MLIVTLSTIGTHQIYNQFIHQTVDQPGHDDQVKYSRIGQQNYWNDAEVSWEFPTACQHTDISDFDGFTYCLVTHQE
jgi:hypothetical protein